MCDWQELQHFVVSVLKCKLTRSCLQDSSLAGHLATSKAMFKLQNDAETLGIEFSSSTILIVPKFWPVQIQTHDFYLSASMEKWGDWLISA